MDIWENPNFDPYRTCVVKLAHGCAECPLNHQCHREEKETKEEDENASPAL